MSVGLHVDHIYKHNTTQFGLEPNIQHLEFEGKIGLTSPLTIIHYTLYNECENMYLKNYVEVNCVFIFNKNNCVVVQSKYLYILIYIQS
jgi:hypothetical protein